MKTTGAEGQDLYKRLKAGESFAELGPAYSEDASARSGGELGFIRHLICQRNF